MTSGIWMGKFPAERTKSEAHKLGPAAGKKSVEDWILVPLEYRQSIGFLGPRKRHVQFVLADNKHMYPTVPGASLYGAREENHILKTTATKSFKIIYRDSTTAIGQEFLKNVRRQSKPSSKAGLVRKNFAAHATDKSNGILVISDEDGQSLKTNAWIPIVSLNQAELVKGSIRGGDRHQLPPLVASSFASARETRRALQDGPTEWLADKISAPVPGDLQLVAVDVLDGETEIEPRTKSRYNLANVMVVMDLLTHLFHKGALGADSDLTIIIPYAEQRSKCVRASIELAAEECIRWSDMTKVA
ncbi:hypothetical protein DTO271G3_6781 [Paecilomyces variotii]|nr:hypothetical protein DTO271G3_6781 [Paecilomyces variotii]